MEIIYAIVCLSAYAIGLATGLYASSKDHRYLEEQNKKLRKRLNNCQDKHRF